jgi:hypothetical protein
MSSKMKKIKCQASRVESCFNHLIELNKKMLVLTMISYKKKIFGNFWGKTDPSSDE